MPTTEPTPRQPTKTPGADTPGAQHAPWCAIGNLQPPDPGRLFTAADIAAATVVEMSSEALTTADTPHRGPIFIGIDPGSVDRGGVVVVEKRPDGSLLILADRGI